MAALVVLAHPLKHSLSHRFAGAAMAALGEGATLLDLYDEGFDPRLTRGERESYYADDHDASGVQDHARLLAAADRLVFVFPTWWFGPPAILKGWIDRAFAPGVAFDHGADFGPIVPRLNALRRVVVVTTLGTPWWVDRFAMRRPVRRIFKTAIVGACAPRARVDYLPLYAAETVGEARIGRFEKRLQQTLAG